MTEIALSCDGQELVVEPGETVLDCLLRHGKSVGFSCRSGHCQACLVRGDPAPADAQAGLKSTLAAQGYFLACQARPERSIALVSTTGAERARAVVIERALIGEDVLRLRLKPETPLDYRPGQFVNLIHPDGAVRSYSLASYHGESFLELHVRKVPGGHVSSWLHDKVVIGDELVLQGPQGSCFYVQGEEDRPLILAGTGTGLAPLWGILRDALEQGHRGEVHLIQGALRADRLYLLDELREVEAAHPQVSLNLCALEGAGGDVSDQALDKFAAQVAGTLDAPRAFLCGDPGLVNKLQLALFMAGVASADILADPFLPTPNAV